MSARFRLAIPVALGGLTALTATALLGCSLSASKPLSGPASGEENGVTMANFQNGSFACLWNGDILLAADKSVLKVAQDGKAKPFLDIKVSGLNVSNGSLYLFGENVFLGWRKLYRYENNRMRLLRYTNYTDMQVVDDNFLLTNIDSTIFGYENTVILASPSYQTRRIASLNGLYDPFYYKGFYYCRNDDPDRAVQRISATTGRTETLEIKSCVSFFVADGYVYYGCGEDICRCNLEDGKIESLFHFSTSADAENIAGHYLIASDFTSWYLCDLTSGAVRNMGSKDWAAVCVVEDTIAFRYSLGFGSNTFKFCDEHGKLTDVIID